MRIMTLLLFTMTLLFGGCVKYHTLYFELDEFKAPRDYDARYDSWYVYGAPIGPFLIHPKVSAYKDSFKPDPKVDYSFGVSLSLFDTSWTNYTIIDYDHDIEISKIDIEFVKTGEILQNHLDTSRYTTSLEVGYPGIRYIFEPVSIPPEIDTIIIKVPICISKHRNGYSKCDTLNFSMHRIERSYTSVYVP